MLRIFLQGRPGAGARHTAMAIGLIALLPQPPAAAGETGSLPTVEIDGLRDLTCPLHSGDADRNRIATAAMLGASDTAALLAGMPGTTAATGGGISSLPILHGLADDRVKTLVDGVPVSSACPNHMNPALSYSAPAATGHLTAAAGITPVSAGGDAIAGTVTADPPPPVFADAGYAAHGMLGTFFRSNNRQVGVNGQASAATPWASLTYDGSWTRARAGHDGNGDRILNSQFENQSHALALALRNEDQQLTIRASHQLTPYEGFPNAYMDLTGNTSNALNAGYQGDFAWGRLDAKVYWQNAKHRMDFLPGRNTTGHMPMDTDATDAGYSLKAELPVGKADLLRLGDDYHNYRLNDWWPPISAQPNGMMSPNAFLNINEGSRSQIGNFAEWEHRWNGAWTSLIGLRNEVVSMNTGQVAGYSDNMMAHYGADAAAFNGLDHARTDVAWDASAVTRFIAQPTASWEFGLARKTRAPNLYERYAWSTSGMAASMIGWFGNGADYVGNPHLKPETADTVSAAADLHDAAQTDWSVKLTPYYTYVENYIDVDKLGASMTPGVNLLRFANHDAALFGADLSGSKALARSALWGALDLSGTAGWTRGYRVSGGGRLYRMQPFHALLALDHRLGRFSSTAELRLVDAKSTVDPWQNEPATPGFAIVNWRTSYRLENVAFAVGIDNLLNRQYYDPNGGVYLSAWRAAGGAGAMGPLPAAGRSFNAGMSVFF